MSCVQAPTRVQTARRQTVVCSAVQPQQQQEVQNRRAVLGLMAAAGERRRGLHSGAGRRGRAAAR